MGHLDTDYPLSQLTICIGFLFVYFLEEICHWILTKVPQEHCPPVKRKVNNFTSSSVTPLDINLEANLDSSSVEDLKKEPIEEDKKDTVSTKSILDIDDNHENIVYDTLELNSQAQKPEEKAIIEEAEVEVKNQQQIMRCVLTDVALSLHAVFEGLAIGLQNKEENIWYLFIAVSIHSSTILFCMGVELLLAGAKIKFIFLQMLALATASPFGILVAVLVTLKTDMQTRAKSTLVVALEGLSAGTILYITFFEVLNREKERRVYRLQRAICIIAGFTLMAVLQFLEVNRHPSVQIVENME